MGRRYGNTFLTVEQVSVLKMRANGMTLDEIASTLGVSRASIHAVLRNALTTVEKARNTLRLYAELTGGIKVSSPPGTRVTELIDSIFREADQHGIKLGIRSVDILLTLLKKLPECVDISRGLLTCDVRATIFTDGNIVVTRE